MVKGAYCMVKKDVHGHGACMAGGRGLMHGRMPCMVGALCSRGHVLCVAGGGDGMTGEMVDSMKKTEGILLE